VSNFEEMMAAAKAKLLKVAKKAEQAEKKTKAPEPSATTSYDHRLTIQDVKEAYVSSGLKPSRSFYFFTHGRPLIYVSPVSFDKTEATPIGALCISKKAPFLSQRPEEWTAGQTGSALGLASSYILGFNSGFDGNAPGHPRCSDYFHQGYADGISVFGALHSEGALTDQRHEPVHMSVEEYVELCRVAGDWN